MLNEPATLASVARLIWQTLEAEYGIDPTPIFADLNIDAKKFHKPGARVKFTKMDQLWRRAVETSGDESFGVKVGERLAPGDLFVLGHAWLASDTLLDAFERLCRFLNVLSSLGNPMEVIAYENGYALVEIGAQRVVMPSPASLDAGAVAFLKMCDFVTATEVRPLSVSLPQERSGSSVNYAKLFGCPVSFGGDDEVWVFSAADVEAPLTGSIPDVADAADRIAETYIDSLVEGAIAHEVREMLLQLLPSGHVDQDTIAEKLYRSRSTLQRQLVAEGTSYRDILDSTRKNLAEVYLKNGEHSQAQIAFMVGFSDQSNFSRAFKRWTGVSPGEFQKI
jgi:AraC-like DNA-binding protein